MKPIDEYERELAHRLENKLDRDDERERVAMRRLRRKRRPRYPRFETISRMMEAFAESPASHDFEPVLEKEAA
jgi:hypothetical protein